MIHVRDDGSAGLSVLVGAGAFAAEMLLLIGPPVDGRVVVRRWSSDDWSGAAEPASEDARQLLAWIQAQAAAGRTLSQSVYALQLWLRGEGIVSLSP